VAIGSNRVGHGQPFLPFVTNASTKGRKSDKNMKIVDLQPWCIPLPKDLLPEVEQLNT
jgi:hypothetical protein